MPFNIQSAASYWARIFGDTAAAGDGSSNTQPLRFDHYNSDTGQSSTTVTVDGDLATIDTAGERLSLDPTANTSGASNVKYSQSFILRWVTALLQDTLGRLTLGQSTMANSLRVTIASDQSAVIGRSNAFVGTGTIQRAANVTAYTGTDLIGGATTIANVGSSGGQVFINSIDLILNITAVPSGMGNMILALYDVTPPSAIADNGAFTLASGDRASFLCLIPLGTPTLAPGGGTVVLQNDNVNRQIKLAAGSTSLFCYLITTTAFTPAANSETYTIRLMTTEA